MLRYTTLIRCLAQSSPVQACCRLMSSYPVTSQSQIKPVQCLDSIARFLGSYDTFLLDCDGVLWDSYHDTQIPGIPEAVNKLHKHGKKVLYVTNNSIISRFDLKEKFQRFGFDSEMDNIFSNGHASAVYLRDIVNVEGKVYLVGGRGMKWELDQQQLDNVGQGPDPDQPTADVNEMLRMKFEDDVGAVLVGFDPYVSYNKIYKAASYLTNPDCHFVATNDIERGVFIGTNNNRRMPMTGMIVNAISETSNRKAVVVGKPETVMFQCLVEKHPDIDRARTVMIGDSLKADIGFSKAVGIDSALVLTGNSKLEQLNDMPPHLAPTYVINSLADIAK